MSGLRAHMILQKTFKTGEWFILRLEVLPSNYREPTVIVVNTVKAHTGATGINAEPN